MDPQVIADLLDTFNNDGAPSRLPWSIEGDAATFANGLGEGLRFEANGREWRVLQVGVADDDLSPQPYRGDAQLRDAARLLPPVCFAPLVSQYTRLLRDPRWEVREVPQIMSAMLHDPILFHLMDTNPLAPLSDYRVSAMTRWWGVVAKPALRYDYSSGRPLKELMGVAAIHAVDDGRGKREENGEGGGATAVKDAAVEGPATTDPHDTRMPVEELRRRYRDVKTVLTLIAATSAPYRCSRPPNAAVSGCTARLVFCKDPSIIYLGLLLNAVLRELPRKVMCSMSVFRLIAEGWGNSPSLQDVLQAAWEEYQDVLLQIRIELGAATEASTNGSAPDATTSADSFSGNGTHTSTVGEQPQRSRHSLPHLRFPSQLHENTEDNSPTASAAAVSSPNSDVPLNTRHIRAVATAMESGQQVEFGIPLGQERTNNNNNVAARYPPLFNFADPFSDYRQRFEDVGRRLDRPADNPSFTPLTFPLQRTAAPTIGAAAGGAAASGAGGSRHVPADGPTTSNTNPAPADSINNSSYRTEDADRICLESMQECSQSPELLLWWCRCRLLAYQLLDSAARVSVESTRALEYFRQLWSCAPLAREILEDDQEALLRASLEPGAATPLSCRPGSGEGEEKNWEGNNEKTLPHTCKNVQRQARLATLQQRARGLYASLVGTIADLSKFWFSIRVAQSTLNAVSSSAPETNIIWSIVNATVPPRRRFQREEFASYAEHWQYALLVDDYVTQPMGFRVSTRGRTMVTQLLHVLSEYPTFYPALVTRTLAMLNRREMIVAELNGRLVAAVARCLRFYLPPMPPVLSTPSVAVEHDGCAALNTSPEDTTNTAPQVEPPPPPPQTTSMAADGISSPSPSLSTSTISTPFSTPSAHLNTEEFDTTAAASALPARQQGNASAAPASEAAAAEGEADHMGRAEASTSGLNYESYVLSDTEAEASDEDDAHNNTGNNNGAHEAVEEDGTLERHPRQRRRAAKKAALARQELLRQQEEAAMPILTTKAYDAILTCLDVLRMLVRHAHLSVNPMSILFTTPTAATTTAEASASAFSASVPVPNLASAAASHREEEQESALNHAAAAATAGDENTITHNGNDDVDGAHHHHRRHRALRFEPYRAKSQCDLYTLLHQLVHQTRYGPLAAAALRFFTSCVHYNVRDMVPLFAERGLLNTILTVARRPRPSTPQQLDQRNFYYRSRPLSNSSSGGSAAAPLLFALDSLEETGLPNIPPRAKPQQYPSAASCSPSPPSFSAPTSAAQESPDSHLPAWQSPLVTTHPPLSLTMRYVPREEPFLNTAAIRMVLPEFVEAMTVHQATHAVFRKHLQWIPALLESLTVTPALSSTTLQDICALWEDEEARELETKEMEGAEANREAVNEEEKGEIQSNHEEVVSDEEKPQQRQQRAQLECRSSPTYKCLLRALLASRNASRRLGRNANTTQCNDLSCGQRETAEPTETAAAAAASSTNTMAVDATLIRLVELCRLHMKREEVGYKNLQSAVKDMSRVLTEVLQPPTLLTEKFKPAIQHELTRLGEEVRQIVHAVRAGATHERPFAASSYGSTSSKLSSPRDSADAYSQDSQPPPHADALVPESTLSAGVKENQRRVFPNSREDFFQLLVRTTELCRSLNSFFAFFSAVAWTDQRRLPRLARNSAERQEGMQALKEVLNSTMDKFHRAIQQLWSLMGCQIPLNVRGTPLSICEQGIPDGESSLLSYVQAVIGQSIHPRILSDYLWNTQPSPAMEAVLRSTVRCILHHSTRSLFYHYQPVTNSNSRGIPTRRRGKVNAPSSASNTANADHPLLAPFMEMTDEESSREKAPSGQHVRNEELRRLLLHITDTETVLSTSAAAASSAVGEERDNEEAKSVHFEQPSAAGRHADPYKASATQTGVEAASREPVIFENTSYPCYDCVSNVLRPLSMGDGIFLRQLLEAWRATTSNSSNSGGGGASGFGNVVGGSNRRDADCAQWRSVFGDVLRHVVDATVVRAPLNDEDVPNLLRSLRSSNTHTGLTNVVLSLYDRSAETGAAFSSASNENSNTNSNNNNTSLSSSATAAVGSGGSRGLGHADPNDQLMQYLLQDTRNFVSEPATAWMTVEAWQEATTGISARTAADGSGGSATAAPSSAAEESTAQNRADTAMPSSAPAAVAAGTTPTTTTGVHAFSSELPPASIASPPPLSQPSPSLPAVTSALQDVIIRVEGEGATLSARRSTIGSASSSTSSALTPTLQTTAAGGVNTAAAVEGSAFLFAEPAADNAAVRTTATPTLPLTLPLFTPVNPIKALRQWVFITLFSDRRNGVLQAMSNFSHISAFRRDNRTRAVLPLNTSALIRTVQADLVAAFDKAVRGVFDDAVTRERCATQTAAIRENEPERYARAVDDIVATRRRLRDAALPSSAGDRRNNTNRPTLLSSLPVEHLFQSEACLWLDLKPRELVLIKLPLVNNIDACLEDINLTAAHRVLWELAVLDAVCTGGNSSPQDVDPKELVKMLTYAVQMLILLSRLFLSPGTSTTHKRPRSPFLTANEGKKLDEAAAAASQVVVATQGELRRVVVYMGILIMNFLEGCDARARGQHHTVVESLLYCVLDVWPKLPGFPMLPYMYTAAVDLMSQLRADTFGNVRLQGLLKSTSSSKKAEETKTGGNEKASADEQEGEDNKGSSDEDASPTALFAHLSSTEEDAVRVTRLDTATAPGANMSWSPLRLPHLANRPFTGEGRVRDMPMSGSEDEPLVVEAADGSWQINRYFLYHGQPYGAAFQRGQRRDPQNGHVARTGDAYSSHQRMVSPSSRAERASAVFPSAHLWERMLPWLCDIVTGNIFPLNSLSEPGQRMLRRRACKVFWFLWTTTDIKEQPHLLAFMLHRVLSDARRNVGLLEYMGVLLSQVRGVVVVEALVLTPLPEVIVAVVKKAIAAVAEEQAEWERQATIEKAQAITAEAQGRLRAARRRRRRAFATTQETLHGQLVSFLTVFRNARSDAPVVRDRFKRVSAAAHGAQTIGSQCNYFDVTRSTFCWHGHQCHRHHVMPVNSPHSRDNEDIWYPWDLFGIGAQCTVDALITVLEDHGFEGAPLRDDKKRALAAKTAAAPELELATPLEAANTHTPAETAKTPASRRYPSSLSSEDRAQGQQREQPPAHASYTTGTYSSNNYTALDEPRPPQDNTRPDIFTNARDDVVPSSPSAAVLVRHERLTPHGFISMTEGAERRTADAGTNFAGTAVHNRRASSRPDSRDDHIGGPWRLTGDQEAETQQTAAGVNRNTPGLHDAQRLFPQPRHSPRQREALENDLHNSPRHAEDVHRLVDTASGDGTAAEQQHQQQQPPQPAANDWGGSLHEGASAGKMPMASWERVPLPRHQLKNPFDPRRRAADPLHRAIIPYFALFSRELCEEVLRLSLDFMGARLRDQAVEKAEEEEEALAQAKQNQRNQPLQQQQDPPRAPSMRPSSSLNTALAAPGVLEGLTAHDEGGGEMEPSASSSALASPVTSFPPLPASSTALPAAPAADIADAAAAAEASTPTATTPATAMSAAARVAAQMKLPQVEVAECRVSEVMVHFLLTCFFTYYRECQHILQTYHPSVPAATTMKADKPEKEEEKIGEAQRTADPNVPQLNALPVLCAYITSVTLPIREKCIIFCELLLTDMDRVVDDIWRDMARVLAIAVRVQHKARKLTDKSFSSLTAFHERRLHALATAEAKAESTAAPATATTAGHRKTAPTRDTAQHHRRAHQPSSTAAGSEPTATRSGSPWKVPVSLDVPHTSTKDREGVTPKGKPTTTTATKAGKEDDETQRLHQYVVPVGIFLANLEPYITRQPTAFYYAVQRYCEVRWVLAHKGEVPAAWLGVWVQPRPSAQTPGKASTTVSESHSSRSTRAGGRRARAAAATSAAANPPAAVVAPITAGPSREFVDRVSCFMQHLTRNVEAGLGRASHGVEVLAAVEQLPGVCAALLSLSTPIPVPNIYASILTTHTPDIAVSRSSSGAAVEYQTSEEAAPDLIPVPPFLALVLYFCGTLSEADRSNPFDFAAGIDFAAGLLAFNLPVVADAVMSTLQRLVAALELFRKPAEAKGSEERRRAEREGPDDATHTHREPPPERWTARQRSLIRCLHDFLCFLECGSPRPATAALPARQRAAQQAIGGNAVQEAFLRFHRHLANCGLLSLLFRVCRLRTCEHGRDATSLLQLLHHQLLTFGEYKMATMLSPGQQAYAAEQRQETQDRQRQTGMTSSGASLWPPLLATGRARFDPSVAGHRGSEAYSHYINSDTDVALPMGLHVAYEPPQAAVNDPMEPLQDLFHHIESRFDGPGRVEAVIDNMEEDDPTHTSDASFHDYAQFQSYPEFPGEAMDAAEDGEEGVAGGVAAGEDGEADVEGDEMWEPMRPVRRHPHYHRHHRRHRHHLELPHTMPARVTSAAREAEEQHRQSTDEYGEEPVVQHTAITAGVAATASSEGESGSQHRHSSSGSAENDEPYYENEWEDYTSSNEDVSEGDGGRAEEDDDGHPPHAEPAADANAGEEDDEGNSFRRQSPMWEFAVHPDHDENEDEDEDEEAAENDEEDEETEEEEEDGSEPGGFGSSDGEVDESFLGDSTLEERYLSPQHMWGHMFAPRHGDRSNGGGGGVGGRGGIGGARSAAVDERAQTFAACAYHAMLVAVRSIHRGNVVETEQPAVPVLHATEEEEATKEPRQRTAETTTATPITTGRHGEAGALGLIPAPEYRPQATFTRLVSEALANADAQHALRGSQRPAAAAAAAASTSLSPPSVRDSTPSEQLMHRQQDSHSPLSSSAPIPLHDERWEAMAEQPVAAGTTGPAGSREDAAPSPTALTDAPATPTEPASASTATATAAPATHTNSNNNDDGMDDVTERILALFAAGSTGNTGESPVVPAPEAAAAAAVPAVTTLPEPQEPEPWEGVLDAQFLNEMPEDVRSEILFDSMQTLRGPDERDFLGQRTRLYPGFLRAMPEAAQRHAMEVEARWVRVTRADDSANDLYQTILSVDAETRRDLLLQCDLELLQPYPELLREATELRADVERQREELEAAQRIQEERRQRQRELAVQQARNQRNSRRWVMDSNGLLRDGEDDGGGPAGSLRVSTPAMRELDTVEGVMATLYNGPGLMYSIINHELFLARRLYRCEGVLQGLNAPLPAQGRIMMQADGLDGGAAVAPQSAWLTPPLIEEVHYGQSRLLRHGGSRGGNALRRLQFPPISALSLLPVSPFTRHSNHRSTTPPSSSSLLAPQTQSATPSSLSTLALSSNQAASAAPVFGEGAQTTSAAAASIERIPSGVPTALAALSESIVPVQESPYHRLSLPLPEVPDDVLSECLELLRFRATAALSLPYNANAGISCLDQQLQHMLQLLMGNPIAAGRLVCQLLDVMANTPTTVDETSETARTAAVTLTPHTSAELAGNQMFIKSATAFLVSLMKQNQAVTESFFLLPDGALNSETLKSVEAPMDAVERRCAEYGLWNRLWKVCRQHVHVQGFLYSLDQLLRQLVRSQKMFRSAEGDHEVTNTDDPLAEEQLTESLILYPRHPHRLRWISIRSLSNYEEGGYICNVCGANPGYDYCFHCPSCQFDLCPSCSRARLTLDEMRTRISRSSALFLMAVPETVTSMTAFLRHPLCRPNIAANVVQLMSHGLQECAARESCSPLSLNVGSDFGRNVSAVAAPSSSSSSSTTNTNTTNTAATGTVTTVPVLSHGPLHNRRIAAHASTSALGPLQILEQELVQMAEARVRAMKEARDAFRQEVYTILHLKSDVAKASATSVGSPGSMARHAIRHQLSIPEGYIFDTDTAMALLVKLDIKDSEGDAIQRLFEPYVVTHGAEPRAFTMLWRASQAYLHDVSTLLEHLTPQEVLPLPSCVSSILQTFCRYHLSDVHHRGAPGSARTLTGSRSNLAGETENFLHASTKPSSVSDRAVKELSEQEGAAQSVTAVGTRLSEEGLNAAEEHQRRLPHVVRMILEENRVTLNTLLHWDGNLLKENFSFLNYEPNLIDFNFKLSDFRRRLGLRRGSSILLRVKRDNCLLDSFKELQKQRSLGGQLHVRFEGEEGADAGGLTHEWLQILSEALVDERYALFVHSQDSASFQPNPFSSVNPNHLEYFQFAGAVVALAITHNVPIDIHFTRAFYRHIIGHRPVFADLQSFDQELYTNLNWIMENDVTNLALTFAVNYNRFGSVEEEELEPNGKNKMVTNANKQQYVRLLCEFHMTRRTEEQLLRFLKGFYSVIPRREIQCFTENELELVISGMPDIDVEDLRTHTVYEGYSSTSPQIRWFWEAVNAMTKEDLANLLQFTTGSSKVPHGGFGHLEGSNGRSLPFTISRWAVNKDDLLPQAHTCFNKIDLPVYTSAAVLKEKLMLAITYGSMGFTMV